MINLEVLRRPVGLPVIKVELWLRLYHNSALIMGTDGCGGPSAS
jgi:hypothetical protein